MSEPNTHHCPGCGKPLRYSARTPWYFCGGCTKRATDARGWPIRFIGFGAEWAYAEGYGPDAHDRNASAVACMIDGRPVIVHEARQGGVVAEPILKEHLSALKSGDQGAAAWHLQGLADLTIEKKLEEVVAARLTNKGRTLSG